MLISDAFQDLTYWNGYMQPHAFEGVALDTHIYQVFSNEVRALCLPASPLSPADVSRARSLRRSR